MKLLLFAGFLAAMSQTCQSLMRHSHTNVPSQQATTPFRQVLRNLDDTQYYGNITVGGQVLEAVFDTGSLELIVISAQCTNCGRRSRLYKAHHPSHQYGERTVLHSYGSGSISSREAYDTVMLGPYQDKQAPFWEVYDAAMPVLSVSDFQAIVGLSPIPWNLTLMRNHAEHNGQSFANLQKMMGIPEFSICLGQEPLAPGMIRWNDPLPYERPSDFMEVNLLNVAAPTKQWIASLSNVRVGDEHLACAGQRACGAIIDSGTSLLAMPPSVANRLRDAIGHLDADCTNLHNLPSLRFKLGGVELSLPPASYIFKAKGQLSETLAEYVELGASALTLSSSSCQVLVMTASLSMDGLGETWILGMPFFRKYYTSFLQHPPRLRVAEATSNCEPATQELIEASLELDSLDMGQTSRHVDVSKLRAPYWLRRTAVDTRSRSNHPEPKEPKRDVLDDSALETGSHEEVGPSRHTGDLRSGLQQVPLGLRLGVSIGDREPLN